MQYPHRPVLVHETVRALVHDPEGVYVDGTSGSGGHSLAIAGKLAAGGRLICLDRDPEAVRQSRERLRALGKRGVFRKASFGDLHHTLQAMGVVRVEGILLDLGMSSYQLDQSGRGFSFQREEPLDMRMDPGQPMTAQELVQTLPEKELERLLRDFGEERRARQIARAIVRVREEHPIRSTSQLASLIEKIVSGHHRSRSKHPATRSFQALRIAVNRELDELGRFLDIAPELLNKGGRLAVISYHSLEDRMVKNAMRRWEGSCTCPPDLPVCTCNRTAVCRRLNKRGIRPGTEETARNPRARSAVLRVAERV